MPMQLSEGALGEVLLGSGYVCAGGQVGDNLLSNPPTLEETRMRVRETPFEVDHGSGIRRLRSQVIGICVVQVMVRSS